MNIADGGMLLVQWSNSYEHTKDIKVFHNVTTRFPIKGRTSFERAVVTDSGLCIQLWARDVDYAHRNPATATLHYEMVLKEIR